MACNDNSTNDLSKADLFWNLVELLMQCEIPKFLRNLLSLKGFNNVVSIKEMDNEDINDLESFAQSATILECLPKDVDRREYFGDYANNVKSFQLGIGYKKMLKEVICYTSEKYMSDGPQFFDPLGNNNMSALRTAYNRYGSLISELKSRHRKETVDMNSRWLLGNTTFSVVGSTAERCSISNNKNQRMKQSSLLTQDKSLETSDDPLHNDEIDKNLNMDDVVLIEIPNAGSLPTFLPEENITDNHNAHILSEHTADENNDDQHDVPDGVDQSLNEKTSPELPTHKKADTTALEYEKLTQWKNRLRVTLFERVKEFLGTVDIDLAQHVEQMKRDNLIAELQADEKTSKFYSQISCLLCKKKMRSIFTSFRNLKGGQPAQPAWNLSNYERHLFVVHSLKPRKSNTVARATRSNVPQTKCDDEHLSDEVSQLTAQETLTNSDSNEQTKTVQNPTTHQDNTINPLENPSELENNGTNDPQSTNDGNVITSYKRTRDESPNFDIVSKKSSINDSSSIRSFEVQCLRYEINCLTNENKQLEKDRRSLELDLQHFKDVLSFPKNQLLTRIVNTAMSNTFKRKQSYRFDDVTKSFSAYTKIIGGLQLYEFIHTNMPILFPSPSTVDRYIFDKGPRITEGFLRVDELKSYLLERNLPLVVWIAEDATRNIGKVVYDHLSNQLVGFVPALDENGMPTQQSFPARTSSEIEDHFENNIIGTSTYTIIAQPLAINVPPFIMTLFLTDNKFTSTDVVHRWNFIKLELMKKEITAIGFSSDGDTKCLKAMKFVSEIGTPSQYDLNCEWIALGKLFTASSDGLKDCDFVQDPTHVITKLRNCITKPSKVLPFGDKIISIAHLKSLLQNVSKDKHLLTNSDINTKDRQNFRSAEKTCHIRVRQCLQKHVAGSEATVIFLKMMDYARSAFLDRTLSVKERIKRSWYAVFIVRAWRSWISQAISVQKAKKKEFTKLKKNSKKSNATSATTTSEINLESPGQFTYTMSENFISSNAYTCLELNAQTLIKLIIKLRNTKQTDLFLPFLFGSQGCESTFRQIRSLSSTFSTVVNCSISDMLHRLRRIQFLNDTAVNCDGLIFPRASKTVSVMDPPTLPTDTDIVNLIEIARQDALSDVKTLGIDTDSINFHCQVQKISQLDDVDDNLSDDEVDLEVDEYFADIEEVEEDEFDENEKNELERDTRILRAITGTLHMKNCTASSIDIFSKYVEVIDQNGNIHIVRKSSIVWLLSQRKYSLSSDRLQRVRDSDVTENQRVGVRRKDDVLQTYPIVSPEIWIGDWCVFYLNERFLIGNVLGFSYLNCKNYRQKEYSRDFANISIDSNTEIKKTVGVLCSYYTWDNVGVLKEAVLDDHCYVNVTKYRTTLMEPTMEGTQLKIPLSQLDTFST